VKIQRVLSLDAVAVVAAAAISICAGAACIQTPTRPSPEQEPAPEAPRPISPPGPLAVRQNDPTTGCVSLGPNRGSGFKIDFAWAPVAGAVSYLACYWHGDLQDVSCSRAPFTGFAGPNAYIHTSESRATVVQCAFVADFNLSDWHWKVAARFPSSGWGAYSPTVDFTFPPCRLLDGRPCSAP
jgi:hypothetical protein